LRQQHASRKPGVIPQHFAPCALLLQKCRAHLFSPFQCEYVPDILEGKQQSVADISVTVSSNEAQQILT
jgi:hypothetical protein